MASNLLTEITIRPATPSDAPNLSTIDHASDILFSTHDPSMSIFSTLPPNPPDHYLPAIKAGHAWIATTTTPSSPQPIAFIAVKHLTTTTPPSQEKEKIPPSKSLFIHQISTHLSHTRRGIATQLLQHVELWARERGYASIELTTFRDVPFNKGWYEKMGFGVVCEDEDVMEEDDGEKGKEEERGSKELKEELERERGDEILGKWERVGMRKVL